MQPGSSAADDETLLSVGEEPKRPWGAGLRRGDTLGRYVVLERLGEGGMGIVYACYDPELNRKLAIKLLRASTGGDTRALAAEQRLLREAQAMAQLSHPNVVTVHDVGTHQGGVYVAMEFVDCVTIREWSQERERTWEEVIALFNEAGKGLIAAHAKGLIHRDFKPDNVLVAKDGRILVTDFGLARAMDEGPIRPRTGESVLDSEGARHHWTPNEDALNFELTQVGSVMGTPAYMAPEQHAGLDTNARSDQFSFCVALFEALYGCKPFQGKTLAALSLAITSGEIVEVDRAKVPAWIDAAVRRGLSPAAAKRFEDMPALLAALNEDPRAARRRLWGALAVVGLLGVVVVGQRMLESRQQRECNARGDAIETVWNAERVSRLADDNGDEARAASLERLAPRLDGYAKRWRSTARDLCIAEKLDGSLSAQLGQEARQCMQERADALDALAAGVEEADAKGLYSLLESVSELPRIDDCADPGFLEARPPLPEDVEQRQEVVEARRTLAKVRAHRAAADVEGARKLLEPLMVRAGELGYEPLVARTFYEAAQVDMDAGLPKDAVVDFQAAMASALRAGLDPLAARSAGWLARALGNQMGRKEEGLAWGEMAWALHERSGGEEDLLAAEIALNVGLVHHAAVELEATKVLYERALAIRQDKLGPAHPQIALVMNNLANIYWARAEWDEGLRRHAAALAMREQQLGADHPACGSSHNNIGLIEHDRGNYEKAIASFQRAVDIDLRVFGPDHRLVGLSSGNIGMSMEALGRYEEALAAYEVAERVASKTLGVGSPGWLEPARGRARVALMMGRTSEARVMLEHAVEAARTTVGEGHAELAGAQCDLADALVELGEADKALALLHEAYPVLVEAFGAENPRMARHAIVDLRARLDAEQPEEVQTRLAQLEAMVEPLDANSLDALEVAWLRARVEGRLADETPKLLPRVEALGPPGKRLLAHLSEQMGDPGPS